MPKRQKPTASFKQCSLWACRRKPGLRAAAESPERVLDWPHPIPTALIFVSIIAQRVFMQGGYPCLRDACVRE